MIGNRAHPVGVPVSLPVRHCGSTALRYLVSGRRFRIVASFPHSLYVESLTGKNSSTGDDMPRLWCLLDQSAGHGPLHVCIDWPSGWQPCRGLEFSHRPEAGSVKFPGGPWIDYSDWSHRDNSSQLKDGSRALNARLKPDKGSYGAGGWQALARLRPAAGVATSPQVPDSWQCVAAIIGDALHEGVEGNSCQPTARRDDSRSSANVVSMLPGVQGETGRFIQTAIRNLFRQARPWFENRLGEDEVDSGWLDNHQSRTGLRRLLGLGPGLTPAGDDFLAGLMTVFHASGLPATATALFRTIRPQLSSLTNPVSAAHLLETGQGRVSERGQAIVRKLDRVLMLSQAAPGCHNTATTCEPGMQSLPELEDLQHTCSAYGATSGWDFLAGAALALYLIKNSQSVYRSSGVSHAAPEYP